MNENITPLPELDTEHLRAGATTGPAPWVRRQLVKTCNHVDRLTARVKELEEALREVMYDDDPASVTRIAEAALNKEPTT